MRSKLLSSLIVGGLLGFSASAAPAQATEPAGPSGPVELDRRYIDPIHGFSLCPPAGTERKREFSPSRLVSWLGRDEATGAIVWTMTVTRAVEPREEIDLKEYSKALAEKLARDDAFKVESLKLDPVADKPAMDMRGLAEGTVRAWKRQVWVMPKTGVFLIFSIAGPVEQKDRLDAVLTASVATLRITDPKAELEARKAHLKNGEDLLKTLTDKQFQAAIAGGPQWYLLTLKGQDVGFVHQTESAARREGSEGFEVQARARTQLPKDEVRYLKRVLFTTADRSLELWREALVIGTGERAVRMIEDGIKQEDLVLCNINRCNQERAQKMKVPADIYLPRATSLLLPRLLDLSRKETYAFAVYSTETNNFDMRTFSVVGPETISLGGAEVQAVRLTDQPAADAEAATLWIDAKGRLLRMQTAEGLVMETAAREQVLLRHPKAEDEVAAMDK